MSDLEKYITQRKQKDAEFAKDYDEGFEDFKAGKTFVNVDWEKAREIVGKAPDIKAEDYDKLQ